MKVGNTSGFGTDGTDLDTRPMYQDPVQTISMRFLKKEIVLLGTERKQGGDTINQTGCALLFCVVCESIPVRL